jgi:hypothetical protein
MGVLGEAHTPIIKSAKLRMWRDCNMGDKGYHKSPERATGTKMIDDASLSPLRLILKLQGIKMKPFHVERSLPELLIGRNH